MVERVIEEQAKGVPGKADSLRKQFTQEVGANLSSGEFQTIRELNDTVVPGSPESKRLKEVLMSKGLWSQYLEVGLGEDAEIFTKSQPMSAVGVGAYVISRERENCLCFR